MDRQMPNFSSPLEEFDQSRGISLVNGPGGGTFDGAVEGQQAAELVSAAPYRHAAVAVVEEDVFVMNFDGRMWTRQPERRQRRSLDPPVQDGPSGRRENE